MVASRRNPPYLQSPAIIELNWAPACTISRMAQGGTTRHGSDNWPLTWADDDNLYAYRGFQQMKYGRYAHETFKNQ